MRPRPDRQPEHKPASMAAKRKRARELGYLRDPSTIRAHLLNEFGRDAAMPPASFLEMVIFERGNQDKLTASRLNREPARPRDRRNYSTGGQND